MDVTLRKVTVNGNRLSLVFLNARRFAVDDSVLEKPLRLVSSNFSDCAVRASTLYEGLDYGYDMLRSLTSLCSTPYAASNLHAN